MESKEFDFLKVHQESMEVLGFWDEQYKSTILRSIESQYKTDVIRCWCIGDITIKDDKVLLKWTRRYEPLSDDQIKEKYGR